MVSLKHKMLSSLHPEVSISILGFKNTKYCLSVHFHEKKSFSFPGVMPYSGLTGMEVVDFLKSGQRLKQPDGCPDEL